MKVLVIPDVHLKPWMFQRASELMKETGADRAVCLMDIADDWNKQFALDLYEQTYDAAIRFAEEYPDTLWCYGNHDICYLWNQRESGYSYVAPRLVCEKLRKLRERLPDERQLAFIHRIDDVLFSHGGIADAFVRTYLPYEIYENADKVSEMINGFGWEIMWQNLSPIWYRPNNCFEEMYGSEKLLQVVGHTPVTRIERMVDVISCDVFSTDRAGKPIGTQEFPILDTVTWTFEGRK